MKSKYLLLGLAATGLVLSAAAVGCGDDADTTGNTTSSDGGSPEGGAGPTTTTMVTVTNAGGGTTTGGGDGNDTLETATALEPNGDGFGITGEDILLDPAETDVDFYSFQGTAGPWLFSSDAKPDDDPFAEGYPDLVITVFDSAGKQIAQNDDPFPRSGQDSSLLTILPADGKYYIKVEEFCEFAGAGVCDDGYFDALRSLNYAVGAGPLDPADNSIVPEATEPNQDAANAAVMEYETTGTAGDYFLSIAYGEFTPAADIDGIKFTVPADLTITAGSRARADFVLPPGGTNQNGSGLNPGVGKIIDLADMSVIAQLDLGAETSDPTRADFSLPVIAGHDYLFQIAGGPAPAEGGGKPFWFALHGNGSGNPVETQEATNSFVATPETIIAADADSYFIEGDLADLDTDHFSVATVPGDGFVNVACAAQRNGSGVRGFKAEVLKADGTALPNNSATETAAEDLFLKNVAVPGTETKLIVKFSKTTQAPGITGTYYRCGINFAADAIVEE